MLALSSNDTAELLGVLLALAIYGGLLAVHIWSIWIVYRMKVNTSEMVKHLEHISRCAEVTAKSVSNQSRSTTKQAPAKPIQPWEKP